MPTPCEEQEPVKVANQLLRTTLLVGKTLLFRVTNPSLEGILMQPAEELLQVGPQIKAMKPVRSAGLKSPVGRQYRDWPQFNILALPSTAFRLQPGEEFCQIRIPGVQRVAVIGERQ